MTQIRCPKLSCIYWKKGWCQSEEIELDLRTLSCMTFEESVSTNGYRKSKKQDLWDDVDWDDDESLLEDELDEDMYESSRLPFNSLDLGYPEDEDEDDEPDIEDEYEVVDVDEWDSF